MHEDAKDRFLLQCDEDNGPALLRSEYKQDQFTIHPELPGLFRYRDWLPVRRVLDTQVRPTVFRSEKLAERLGLENLWFAFGGYWPERGCLMETCSFKELETLPVCARLPEGCHGSLVVVSANNTGRAFL